MRRIRCQSRVLYKCASRVRKVSALHPSASVAHNNRFRLFADNAPNFPVGPRGSNGVASCRQLPTTTDDTNHTKARCENVPL
ncbi:hypothetical protein ALC60_08124 [Trachymyrmex zeteki]|uniref:Uncharacterized protein n=1 Tax=Mycetomoellerius zeteki TaxID=64791 RepID=A0A151WXP5_9HYME|nr:hypothetical protein ALC60_08124 [Trachymyrmex zeteki]